FKSRNFHPRAAAAHAIFMVVMVLIPRPSRRFPPHRNQEAPPVPPSGGASSFRLGLSPLLFRLSLETELQTNHAAQDGTGRYKQGSLHEKMPNTSARLATERHEPT